MSLLLAVATGLHEGARFRVRVASDLLDFARRFTSVAFSREGVRNRNAPIRSDLNLVCTRALIKIRAHIFHAVHFGTPRCTQTRLHRSAQFFT